MTKIVKCETHWAHNKILIEHFCFLFFKSVCYGAKWIRFYFSQIQYFANIIRFYIQPNSVQIHNNSSPAAAKQGRHTFNYHSFLANANSNTKNLSAILVWQYRQYRMFKLRSRQTVVFLAFLRTLDSGLSCFSLLKNELIRCCFFPCWNLNLHTPIDNEWWTANEEDQSCVHLGPTEDNHNNCGWYRWLWR